SWPASGCGVVSGASASGRSGWLRQGRLRATQIDAPTNSAAQRIHPSAVVPTPTYFSPEAPTTKVIAGLTYRSGGAGGEQGTQQHGGHASEDQGCRHPELDMAEG